MQQNSQQLANLLRRFLHYLYINPIPGTLTNKCFYHHYQQYTVVSVVNATTTYKTAGIISSRNFRKKQIMRQNSNFIKHVIRKTQQTKLCVVLVLHCGLLSSDAIQSCRWVQDRWRLQVPAKYWLPSKIIHGIIIQKTTQQIFMVVKTPYLRHCSSCSHRHDLHLHCEISRSCGIKYENSCLLSCITVCSLE
jgi:hypothetical protein